MEKPEQLNHDFSIRFPTLDSLREYGLFKFKEDLKFFRPVEGVGEGVDLEELAELELLIDLIIDHDLLLSPLHVVNFSAEERLIRRWRKRQLLLIICSPVLNRSEDSEIEYFSDMRKHLVTLCVTEFLSGPCEDFEKDFQEHEGDLYNKRETERSLAA